MFMINNFNKRAGVNPFTTICALSVGLVFLLSSISLSADDFVPPIVSISKNRKEHVQLYLEEFVSGRFRSSYPQIYTALTNAFEKLPEDVFFTITDRERPIIFVLAITSGIGRYANSTEFIMRESDPPTFQDGFYLVTLADELDDAPTPAAIEGVLLHEMAHRYLEHLRAGAFSCEMERETNRLVKKWGFEKEYNAASKAFGSKKKGDSPCQDSLPSVAVEVRE